MNRLSRLVAGAAIATGLSLAAAGMGAGIAYADDSHCPPWAPSCVPTPPPVPAQGPGNPGSIPLPSNGGLLVGHVVNPHWH